MHSAIGGPAARRNVSERRGWSVSAANRSVAVFEEGQTSTSAEQRSRSDRDAASAWPRRTRRGFSDAKRRMWSTSPAREPKNSHVVATESPRRSRGVPSPRNLHVVAAASPPTGSTESPRRSRGVAATRLRGIYMDAQSKSTAKVGSRPGRRRRSAASRRRGARSRGPSRRALLGTGARTPRSRVGTSGSRRSRRRRRGGPRGRRVFSTL